MARLAVKRQAKHLWLLSLWWLALGGLAWPGSSLGQGNTPQSEPTVILADPTDAYYALAEEIASAEGLSLAHTLDEALAYDPVFLLWVVSPARLSDEVLIAFATALRDRPAAVSTGIISGSTLDGARALWLRADQAAGERLVIANAENLAGHIQAGMVEIDGTGEVQRSLTRANLVRSLKHAGYLTFTGHGGSSYLRLDENTTLRKADLPTLDTVVVATGSCNTFRPWEANSIALAFVDRGAAAYAGFAYSPNAGYLFGEFDGLPFRYTWPEFPVGHVVQLQNRGALQGFAAFPYYFLLGDPRLALQSEPPYRLVGSDSAGRTYTLDYADAPAGVIPVRVPGGAAYPFVRIPGVGMAWQGELFYNSRVQMIDNGADKFVLFEHEGGPFQLQLYAHRPWLQVAGDVVLDALDGTLLFLPDHGGAIIWAVIGVVALIPVAVLLLRRKVPARTLLVAGGVGLAAATLHALYALARVDAASITSKVVACPALAPAATFLLVTAGGLIFLGARSWRGRATGVLVTTLPALAPALTLLVLFGVLDSLFMRGTLGTDVWNCRLALQPLVVFLISAPLLGGVMHVLARGSKTKASKPKEATNV